MLGNLSTSRVYHFTPPPKTIKTGLPNARRTGFLSNARLSNNPLILFRNASPLLPLPVSLLITSLCFQVACLIRRCHQGGPSKSGRTPVLQTATVLAMKAMLCLSNTHSLLSPSPPYSFHCQSQVIKRDVFANLQPQLTQSHIAGTRMGFQVIANPHEMLTGYEVEYIYFART